jgi:hypothetical protein
MQIVNPYHEYLRTIHDMEIDKIAKYYNDLVEKGFDPEAARECMINAVAPINNYYAEKLMSSVSPMYLMCD